MAGLTVGLAAAAAASLFLRFALRRSSRARTALAGVWRQVDIHTRAAQDRARSDHRAPWTAGSCTYLLVNPGDRVRRLLGLPIRLVDDRYPVHSGIGPLVLLPRFLVLVLPFPRGLVEVDTGVFVKLARNGRSLWHGVYVGGWQDRCRVSLVQCWLHPGRQRSERVIVIGKTLRKAGAKCRSRRRRMMGFDMSETASSVETSVRPCQAPRNDFASSHTAAPGRYSHNGRRLDGRAVIFHPARPDPPGTPAADVRGLPRRARR